MFTTLLESRAVHVRNTRGTAMSVLLHAALIGTAVMVTVSPPRSIEARIAPHQPVVYVPATPKVETASVQPHASTGQARPTPVVIDIPTIRSQPGTISLADPVPLIDAAPSGFGPLLGTSTGPVGIPSEGVGGVMDVAYVEKIPHIIGDAPAPRYPDALRSSGISGRAVARFVVDTLGRAELDGVQMIEASHPLFGDAVRNALVRYRFAPGEVSGRKVRTMVQMPFVFTIR